MKRSYAILKNIKRVLHLGMLYNYLASLGCLLVFMISPKLAMRLALSVSQTKTTAEHTQDTSSQEPLLIITHCPDGASVSMKTQLSQEELIFVIKGCKYVLETFRNETEQNGKAN